MARQRLRDKVTDRAKAALGALSSFGVYVAGVGVSFDRMPGRADTGDFELDITDLVADVSAAASESGVGLAICIDEMQDAPTEVLAALLAARTRSAFLTTAS